MRIAIFTDSFLPHISGVCSAVINQANALCGLGHEVMIFRPKGYGANAKKRLERTGELHAKIRDVLISVPSMRQPGLRIALPTVAPTLPVLRHFRPDIIHVHTEWGCGWEGVMLAKMLRKPLVGTFHTFFAEPEYLKQFHLPNHRLTREMMWRYSVFFYNHCDRILSPSRSVANQLMDKGIERAPHLVSNGIPRYEWLPEAAVADQRAARGLDGPCVIYAGRLSEEKSLSVLLRAFRRLTGMVPGVKCVIIGDGPVMKDLQEEAAGLGLTESVRFLGRIPHHQLMKENLLRWGDLFVTASKTENQPVSLLEAMAFGLPIVGPDAKGIPELVHDGVNGVLFPPDDEAAMASGMARLLNDTGFRSHCAAGARRVAEDNQMDAVVRHLVFQYEQTLLSRRTRRRRRLQRRLRSRARPPRA